MELQLWSWKKNPGLEEIAEMLFSCNCCFDVAAASVVRRSKGACTSTGMWPSLCSFANLTLSSSWWNIWAEGPLKPWGLLNRPFLGLLDVWPDVPRKGWGWERK